MSFRWVFVVGLLYSRSNAPGWGQTACRACRMQWLLHHSQVQPACCGRSDRGLAHLTPTAFAATCTWSTSRCAHALMCSTAKPAPTSCCAASPVTAVGAACSFCLGWFDAEGAAGPGAARRCRRINRAQQGLLRTPAMPGHRLPLHRLPLPVTRARAPAVAAQATNCPRYNVSCSTHETIKFNQCKGVWLEDVGKRRQGAGECV